MESLETDVPSRSCSLPNKRGMNCDKHRHDSGYSSPSEDCSPRERRKPLISHICKPADKFLMQGFEKNVLLESLILECVMSSPHASPFKHGTPADVMDAKTMLFTHDHHFGDLFTALNMVRAWCDVLQKKQVNSWYSKHHFDSRFFSNIESYVERNFATFIKTYNLQYDLTFNKQALKADVELHSMLLQQLADNTCVYLGHPVLGYINLKTNGILDIDSSSVFQKMRVFPKVITYVTCRRQMAVGVTSFCDTSLDLLDKKITEMQAAKTVQPVIKEPMGKKTYELFKERWDDKQPGQQRKIRDTVSQECDNSNIFVEYDSPCQLLQIYALPQYGFYLKTVIGRILATVRSNNIDAGHTVLYPSEESGCRLTMMPGAAIADIMFPDDTKVVNVRESNRGSATEKSVRQLIKKYPGVTVTEFTQQEKREKGVWGQLTFKLSKHVESFLSAMKSKVGLWFEKALFTIDTNITRPLPVYSSRQFRFKVKVNRRGIRYNVSFSNQDFAVVNGMKTIRIQGKTAKLKSVDTTSVQVFGIKSSVTKQVIEEAFREIYGIKPRKILHYFETSPAEREDFKHELLGLVKDNALRQKTQIFVEHPRNTDFQLCAEVKTQGIRTGFTLLKQMERECSRNQPLEFTIHSTSHFQMTPAVYEVSKTAIYTKMQNINKVRLNRLSIKEDRDQNENYILYFSSETVWEAEECYMQYSNMLQSADVELSVEQWKAITGEAGNLRLAEIQTKSKSYIYVDKQDMCAYIYGSKSAKAKATEMLTAAPEDIRWRIYKLRGPGKPDTLHAEAQKRLAYPDMVFCAKETGYQFIFNDCNDSYVAFKSTSQNYNRICEELNNLATYETTVKRENNHEVECVACYCPVSVEESLYITETCGHVYCRSCIESQIQVAVENRLYPIKCALDGCEQPLSWLDIANICDCRGSMNKVLNISLSLFVARGEGNKRIKFCPTPDCNGLFLESKNLGSTLECYECKTKLCTYCATFTHADISCTEFQERMASLGNIDACVKTWMALDMDQRKICPNCKMGIEKSEGCNNVNCRNCRKYVCWKCLAHYEKAHQCYDHLREKHGGLFDD